MLTGREIDSVIKYKPGKLSAQSKHTTEGQMRPNEVRFSFTFCQFLQWSNCCFTKNVFGWWTASFRKICLIQIRNIIVIVIEFLFLWQILNFLTDKDFWNFDFWWSSNWYFNRIDPKFVVRSYPASPFI